MKVKTLNELQDLLDAERSWRLKEIADMKSAVQAVSTASSINPKTVIRAGVPLLYAHWEGFIKQSALGYLAYIASRRLTYEELAFPFVVFGAKSHVNSLIESRKAKINIEAVDFLLTKQTTRAILVLSGAVNTESNLSSKVFDNIATSIGIDTEPYESKYNFVDESLLKRRNTIAHGEYLDLDAKEFRILSDEVLILMTAFKNDILNAAATTAYKR